MATPAERYAAARARAAAERTELGAFRRTLDFDLDPFQEAGCAALEEGRGVLVAAPTGAGKTVVGEFAVHLALRTGRKAFYTTPIKALSNQKYGDLARTYGAESVGLLTGDTAINGDAPVVVMTTEVLRNMLYAGSPALEGLGFVVMDEVHYLADRFRGPVWEEVILHLAADVQVVSLSATVSNAEEFGEWLEMVRGDTAVVVSEHRPVPLWQHVLTRDGMLDLYDARYDPTIAPAPGSDAVPPINPELAAALRVPDRYAGGDRRGRGRGRGGPGGRGGSARSGPDGRGGSGGRGGGLGRPMGRPMPRFAVVETLDREGLLPAIVFIFSRAGCDAAVQQCVAAGLRLTTPAEASRIQSLVDERCATLPPEDLQVLGFWEWSRALSHGIAAHHAGLLPLFKETVEELFSQGLVKVVFATETLALGINMPARSVVLERLVKWNGSAHVDVTAGEYTQLTGRAGRRGIDVEGHGVVVGQPGLDPVALAGLASRRTYPLNSSFRPTYNMAVNLVARVGRDRAREVLEMSFAQFQADRGVVGLARQAQTHSEALEGYRTAMECHLGDFGEYAELRRAIAEREGDLSRETSRARRRAARESLEALRPGDVIEISQGRRSGYAVVLDPGLDAGLDGPRPTVLTGDRQVRKLTLADVPAGVHAVTSVRVPRTFSPRNVAAHRDLASSMRNALGALGREAPRRPGPAAAVRSAATEDSDLAELRRRMRAHPCHGCSEREDHARWAERWQRLRREHAALVRRIEGRTGSIARVFDRICDVLDEIGYLEADEDGRPGRRVTADGQWLRSLYAENDLLLAECLRTGAWAELDPAGLAAAVSTLVYSARREEEGFQPHVPGGPGGRLGTALDRTVRLWSDLEDRQVAHRLDPGPAPDLGIVEAVHGWARGRSLDTVLKGGDLAAGDFVRWCKQVIDVLDQLTQAAPDTHLRTTAEKALRGVRRGVVAHSSV